MKHSLLPSRNVTLDQYNEVMSTINATESTALELEECSLSTQLDNVSTNTLIFKCQRKEAQVFTTNFHFWDKHRLLGQTTQECNRII